MTYQYARFTFAGVELDGFKSDDGEYFLNQTQVGLLIEKDDNSFLRWIEAKSTVKKYGVIETIAFRIPGENSWKLVKTDWATKYLFHWFKKDCELAETLLNNLVKSSFDVMIENAIKPVTGEVVARLMNQGVEWESSREFTKSIHSSFQNSAIVKGHPASSVHDRITKLVSGFTAQEARESLALIGINPTIGLDYQQDSEILRLIGCIKLRYSGLKAGTWTEQVDRAYEMVTGRKAN
jgi:hypothetical protein